ncbi:hypothetical protein O5D80_000767 [Batrachochytrium dendrobatidis]|nr:hypothetical protein O5D80_000767 [Batrachochytrium dendrobatidis]
MDSFATLPTSQKLEFASCTTSRSLPTDTTRSSVPLSDCKAQRRKRKLDTTEFDLREMIVTDPLTIFANIGTNKLPICTPMPSPTIERPKSTLLPNLSN